MAFPVVACTTSSGAPLAPGGWSPTILLAPIPTALVGKVEFYSDGVHTVLGPSGWSCSQAASNQGASGLVVSPPGTATPPVAVIPAAGSDGVFAIFDNTGTVQGISLVCPYFIIPSWQKSEAHCSGIKPAGEQTSMPTPDVVVVTDPGGRGRDTRGFGRRPRSHRRGDLSPVEAGSDRRFQRGHRRRVVLVGHHLAVPDHHLRLRSQGVSRCRYPPTRAPTRTSSPTGRRAASARIPKGSSLPRQQVHTLRGDVSGTGSSGLSSPMTTS